MSKVFVDRELLPCPFCGQQDAFVEQLDSDASVVICQGMVDEHSACLARGPVGVQQSDMEDQPGRDTAITEWNRRAQPAEAEGVVDTGSDAWMALHLLDRLSVDSSDELRVMQVEGIVKSMSAALSAVTAERDRLREDAERWRYVSLQGDDTHWLNLLRVDLEDFGGNINAAVDALIDGDTPATAAKEA